MNKKAYQKFVDQVRALPGETILAAAYRCDGHTIFKPEAFINAGLPKEVADHLTRNHGSDGSPKGTIYVNGEAVKELGGIYGLHMLRFLAAAFDVEYQEALGRGTEARHIQAALRQHFSRPVDAGDQDTREARRAH